jgi:pilus assembly protein Flp/PilA
MWPNEDELADVTSWGPGASWKRFRNKVLGDHESSPTKESDMLSQLVKFQAKLAAMRDDRGATAVEYGLMVGLIAVVIIGVVTLLGTKVSSLFQDVVTAI